MLVTSRSRPERAVTTVDLERIALDVPGTGVLRAHAWAGVDPAYPTWSAPGTVTVVVVPGLPIGRPEPTPELLGVIRAYLAPRRTLGTRLLVVGPAYREVSVTATVTAVRGADPDRVRTSVLTRLQTFLDPLTGGPAGLGWPFGRDVYRAEILQQLDIVPGVDHVDTLELVAGGTEPGCGNVCVGPLELVVSGPHAIVVDSGRVTR
jgi:predicted phage baseplate assembly protein